MYHNQIKRNKFEDHERTITFFSLSSMWKNWNTDISVVSRNQILPNDRFLEQKYSLRNHISSNRSCEKQKQNQNTKETEKREKDRNAFKSNIIWLNLNHNAQVYMIKWNSRHEIASNPIRFIHSISIWIQRQPMNYHH